MYLFGHLGTTLGVVEIGMALAEAWSRRKGPEPGRCANAVPRKGGKDEATRRHRVLGDWERLALSAAGRADVRALFLGALLGDLVDKPVGMFFFVGVFGNGRIFGHTLLFAVALALLGVWLFARHSWTVGLWLSVGALLHLVQDQMWYETQTLLWPLHGWSFAWMGKTLTDLGSKWPPAAHEVVFEAAGLVILAQFLVVVTWRGGLGAVLTKGRLPVRRAESPRLGGGGGE